MKTDFEIPYDRYALIAELSRRSDSLGRTALQKKVYLLQELFDVNLGYDFTLYTYGPFTSEIISDLDAAEAMGAVRVSSVVTGFGGYEIKPGPDCQRILSKASLFLSKNQDKLDQLFSDFGRYTAKELELRATIIYVDRDLTKLDRPVDELVETVHEIKPGFTLEQIESAIAELSAKNYVRQTPVTASATS
jgi:hypothetical protein